MGGYWLRYAHLYFKLIRFGVLLITKQQDDVSNSINTSKYNIFLLPYCGVWISLFRRAFDIFMSEYWSNYTNFHSSLPIFSVFVITKQQENGSSSINRKSYHIFFHFSSRVWVLLSHRSFDVLFLLILVQLQQFCFSFLDSVSW